MSVEGRGVSAGGGVGISVGPAVGPSVGIGSIIVNEGPVAPAFLENTMPLTLNSFKPLGEIIFNPEPKPAVLAQVEQVAATAWNVSEPVSVIQQAEEVAARAWEATEPKVQSIGYPVLNHVLDKEKAVVPVIEWTPIPNVIQVQKTKTVYQQASAVAIPSPQEKLVEQIVAEEEIDVKDREEKRMAASEEEEIESIRLKNVVDVPVSEQREHEIEQATDKAEAEAIAEGIEGIEGWRIVKFLPHQHPGNESGIIRNTGLRDGSLDETEQELAAKKFVSKTEVKQRAAAIVSKEKPPVKQDRDGQLVKDQDVARVFKHNIFKSHPAKEVVLRIVKKRKVEVVEEVGQPAQVVTDVIAQKVEEPTIGDLGLSEVFPKAS